MQPTTPPGVLLATAGSKPPYTPAEAAEKLRVSVWTIYRMVRDGELRAHKFRGILRIPAREIDSLID